MLGDRRPPYLPTREEDQDGTDVLHPREASRQAPVTARLDDRRRGRRLRRAAPVGPYERRRGETVRDVLDMDRGAPEVREPDVG